MYNIFKSLIFFTIINNVVSIIHMVPRGHIGIYYRGYRLTEETTESGTYLVLPPPFTYTSTVQITPQTDEINNVQCEANDGTPMPFGQIHVGNHLKKEYVLRTISNFGENYDNYLVKDRVRAQIYIICSKMTSDEIYNTNFDLIDDMLLDFLQKTSDNQTNSGVVIDFVRMSKPQLPENLKQQYMKIAKEKLDLQIATAESLKLNQIHKNSKVKAVAEAEKKRAVAEKENQQKKEEIESQNERQNLIDKRHLDMKIEEKKRKDIDREIKWNDDLKEAEAIYMFKKKEAEGNLFLHTDRYLKIKQYNSIFNNAKHYGNVNPTLILKETNIDDNYMIKNYNISSKN